MASTPAGSVYDGSGMNRSRLQRLEKGRISTSRPVSPSGSMVMRGTFAAPELWRGMPAGRKYPMARCARRVVLWFRAGLEQGHARQLWLQPFELSTNVSLKPMRHVLRQPATPTRRSRRIARRPPRAGGFTRVDEQLTCTSRATLPDWRPAPGYSARGRAASRLVRAQLREQPPPYSFNLQEYERHQLPLCANGCPGAPANDADRRRCGHDLPVMLRHFSAAARRCAHSATAALRIATARFSPANTAGGRRGISTWRSSWTPDRSPPSGTSWR